MNIAEVSRRSGLPAKTIRYYEEIGLVRPARGANGYRRFDARDVHRLAFVARARSLGFSVADCKALLALWEDSGRSSAEVRRIAARQLAAVDSKLRQLQRMRDTLAHLVEACAGDERPDCPILADLAAADPAGPELPLPDPSTAD